MNPSLRRCSLLHHVEGFQDDNLCAALQNWAPLGLRDCLVERVSLDDRVATDYAQLRAITDGAIARDGFGLTGGGIAAIYERAPELTEPARKRLHDCCLFRFTLWHPVAAVANELVRHDRSSLTDTSSIGNDN